MSKGWSGGSTRRWRAIRDLVFKVQGRRCALALSVCTGYATHVHHTLGRRVTGDDLRHLVPACAACNLTVGDPTRKPQDPRPRRVTRW